MKSGSREKCTTPIPEGASSVEEGCATVVFPTENVFYNKVQVINRDLSIAVIQRFVRSSLERHPATEIDVCEALAATGLRSIRYWREIEGLNSIVCNDLDENAFLSIRRNLIHNAIPLTSVIPSNQDANALLFDRTANSRSFHVIDLDPYGSAVPFLHSALCNVADNGLLCVTCTDLPVLTGAQPEACFAKYGYFPLKQKYCHEWAIRTLLATLQQHASRLKKVIVPLVSLFIDFYVRVFVRVYTSPREIRKAHSKYGYVYQCVSCPVFHVVPLHKDAQRHASLPPGICHECDSRFKLGGPIWTAPIHDCEFISQLLLDLEQSSVDRFQTRKRMKGLLTVARDELPDCPLFYQIPNICAVLKAQAPRSTLVRAALVNAGYRVSGVHHTPTGIKTDAPPKVVMDVFRAWVAKQGDTYNLSRKPEIAQRVVGKPIETEISFEIGESSRVSRRPPAYFPNPEKFWGPKTRAGRKQPAQERIAGSRSSPKPKTVVQADGEIVRPAVAEDVEEEEGEIEMISGQKRARDEPESQEAPPPKRPKHS